MNHRYRYSLSRIASTFHPQMLVVQAEAYESWQTTLLQRGSVIVCDIALFACAWALGNSLETISASANSSQLRRNDPAPQSSSSSDVATFVVLVSLHAGPVIVDSIHFQYERARARTHTHTHNMAPQPPAINSPT